MDVVGSEIGQKMRSAIKAKLTELGCYVDDELPDYVMVMVANKRTRAQMEDDLQLFLGDNTELFVNWLHQVLKKLQEVTVTAPLKQLESERNKERSLSKERKSKEKKEKEKLKKNDTSKKAKKKEKEKLHRKKEEKKIHKSKKKSKHHEMIRPNVPPLLMNIEKESEPSITDVFAGQILKNHGIILDSPKEDLKVVETKPVMTELKRPILPIIDPATISSQPEPQETITENNLTNTLESTNISPVGTTREEQIKEINEIDAKIQGLKQKLVEQLDSMSDDEDFLNIRTEAEELMNDFAEDVFQEVSQSMPAATPPLQPCKSPILSQNETQIAQKPVEIPKETPETLPQIELNLPKRPVRERLGSRGEAKKVQKTKEKETGKKADSSERFTPEREPEVRSQSKSAKSRLGEIAESQKKSSISDEIPVEKPESSSKRLTSKVSVLESRPARSGCASVVHVRPRPRNPAPASSLLLRAVADAHKSLLNIPPKVEVESQKVKRALVLPMRRCVDAQNIVIQVPADAHALTHRDAGDTHHDLSEKNKSSGESRNNEEYIPTPITKKILNNEYVPSRRNDARTASRHDDTLIVETINIHNPSVDKEKDTQFIVTMDGYHPNAFLAKKLMTEGLLDEGEEINIEKKKDLQPVIKNKETKDETKENAEPEKKEEVSNVASTITQKKRISDTIVENETQVVIKQENVKQTEKRKSIEITFNEKVREETPPIKKRRASPIVFDVDKKERERQRTDSTSSENHVTVTTTNNTHKYDSVPPLPRAESKLIPCRLFPQCRYGALCAFAHPRCKFAASCTRRGCVYEHVPRSRNAVPTLASHVVPVANYKSISSASLPSICKFYPNCANPSCHFFHPKPCRYGANCLNKLECNFYHNDAPVGKWRYPV